MYVLVHFSSYLSGSNYFSVFSCKVVRLLIYTYTGLIILNRVAYLKIFLLGVSNSGLQVLQKKLVVIIVIAYIYLLATF